MIFFGFGLFSNTLFWVKQEIRGCNLALQGVTIGRIFTQFSAIFKAKLIIINLEKAYYDKVILKHWCKQKLNL